MERHAVSTAAAAGEISLWDSLADVADRRWVTAMVETRPLRYCGWYTAAGKTA